MTLFKEGAVLLDEPVEIIKERIGEEANRARWTGSWGDISQRLRAKYDDVPPHLQEEFNRLLGLLDDMKAFRYQKFDAALGALRKAALLTHVMGLGKTRIALMISYLLDVPTLVGALPRLVRSVWVKELAALGMTDWMVLERPKPSKLGLLPRVKGNVKDLRGYQGIGKVTLKPVEREARTTADVFHPSRVKIISYNMLLPGQQTFDLVSCPKCGRPHNKEKCPYVTINVLNQILSEADQSYLDRLAAQHRKGNLTRKELDGRVKARFGEKIEFTVYECATPMKGAHCPKCKGRKFLVPLGNKRKIGDKTLGNPGYHCARCGYSARTWSPPITRRVKKWARSVMFDESQALKHRSALRSRYALSIRPKYRFLTSGTPATADVLRDLYHQLEWLLGKGVMFPYSSEKNFRETMGYDDRSRIATLHSLLDPIQIRREADDYGVSSDVELPPFKERRLSIPMSADEVANYEAADTNVKEWYRRNHLVASELDLFTKMWILRRAACVPWVDNPNITESTKIAALKVEVGHYLAQGQKVLIGTEMLDMLDAIVAAIPETERIDGNVPIKAADRIINLFQDVCPECNIALVNEFGTLICPACEKQYKTPQVLAVSRMAVREGVTLNKASVVIVTDPSFVYSDLFQFWKRAHRIGASYPFLDVIYMESPGTIEERMYNTAESRKQFIAQAINRKDVGATEKIDIRNFVSDLMATTITRPVEASL